MLNRELCTSYPCQRKTPKIWRIAKIITMLTTSNRSQILPPIAPWNQSQKGEST